VSIKLVAIPARADAALLERLLRGDMVMCEVRACVRGGGQVVGSDGCSRAARLSHQLRPQFRMAVRVQTVRSMGR
jgi:hypothetical protein